MKKLTVLFAVLAMITFASCKKEFTCVCYSIADITKTTPYDKTGKGKDAAGACADAATKVLSIPTETCSPK
jgi:hypothetical protein